MSRETPEKIQIRIENSVFDIDGFVIISGNTFRYLANGTFNAAYAGVIDSDLTIENTTYSANTKLVFKIPFPHKAWTADNPARLVRLWNDLYPELPAVLLEDGWLMPFIEEAKDEHNNPIIPSQQQMCAETVRIYNATGRIVADAFNYQNWKVTRLPDGTLKTICIDPGAATHFISSPTALPGHRRTPSKDSATFWHKQSNNYFARFQSMENYSGYSLIIQTTKALLFLVTYYPQVNADPILNPAIAHKLKNGFHGSETPDSLNAFILEHFKALLSPSDEPHDFDILKTALGLTAVQLHFLHASNAISDTHQERLRALVENGAKTSLAVTTIASTDPHIYSLEEQKALCYFSETIPMRIAHKILTGTDNTQLAFVLATHKALPENVKMPFLNMMEYFKTLPELSAALAFIPQDDPNKIAILSIFYERCSAQYIECRDKLKLDLERLTRAITGITQAQTDAVLNFSVRRLQFLNVYLTDDKLPLSVTIEVIQSVMPGESLPENPQELLPLLRKRVATSESQYPAIAQYLKARTQGNAARANNRNRLLHSADAQAVTQHHPAHPIGLEAC